MRLLKGSAAASEVGDGLMGLWSDGRPTESYPETLVLYRMRPIA